jgi:hypothetical protein
MTDQPDPMAVLELAARAEQLADALAGETGHDDLDATVLIDCLALCGLTLAPTGPGDGDISTAAYLSFE